MFPLPQTSSAGSADYGPRTCLDRGIACGGHCSLFIVFTHAPPAPANTAVRSVRVSACRLLVVTKLTEWQSSSGVVRRMGALPRRFAHGIQHAGPAAALTYSWSPGHCSGCVHGGYHSPDIRQHEHYCILSLPVGIYRNSSAGAPGRGPAKRNGPQTSRDDRPEVNREGPARNKARGTGRTPIEYRRHDRYPPCPSNVMEPRRIN